MPKQPHHIEDGELEPKVPPGTREPSAFYQRTVTLLSVEFQEHPVFEFRQAQASATDCVSSVNLSCSFFA